MAYLKIRVLAVILSGFAAVVWAQGGALESCKKGWALLGDEKYEQAISEFSSAINNEPTLAYPYILRGTAYFYHFTIAGIKAVESVDLQNALADVNKALEIDPDNTIGYITRAAIFDFLNKHKEVIQDCTAVIGSHPQIKPDDYTELISTTDLRNNNQWLAQAYYFRGRAYSLGFQLDKALLDLEKAIEFDPSRELYWLEKDRVAGLKKKLAFTGVTMLPAAANSDGNNRSR